MKINHAFWLFAFITQSVFADFMCNTNVDGYYALYEIDSYTCNYGQYLPANTLGCVSCPTGFTCPGETFNFNEDEFQGIDFDVNNISTTTMNNICANNFPGDLFALYEPNQHTCAQGYYLPANTDECTKCLNDNYCAGGTYTFNKTTAQGITQCPSAHPFAPAGIWLLSQCGRKLHVGDEIMYLHQQPANPTEHRLYVRVNDTVYSVNLTQKQNGTDDIKMSAGANRSLHIMFNDIEYLAHDDSTD